MLVNAQNPSSSEECIRNVSEAHGYEVHRFKPSAAANKGLFAHERHVVLVDSRREGKHVHI